jgi:hypothetical protein
MESLNVGSLALILVLEDYFSDWKASENLVPEFPEDLRSLVDLRAGVGLREKIELGL